MKLPDAGACKVVLFDLDGTLVDTAPDMAQAINRVLQNYDRPPLPYETIRPHVSAGSRGLTELAFPVSEDRPDQQQLQQAFLDHYADHLCVETRLFDQMTEALEAIEQHRRWGIVTNKPGWLAVPLIKQLGLAERSACLIAGDTLSRRKPHPDPLLHACKLLHVSPAACLYLGDDERDILSANAADMPSAVAAYGYLRQQNAVANWPTDYYIDSPTDLIDWSLSPINE